MRGFFVARIRWLRKPPQKLRLSYFMSSICRARFTERFSWRW
jgi:hypothetical protein